MFRCLLILAASTLMLANTHAEEPVRLLLLGDSIRMGYAPVVKKALGDSAIVLFSPKNGGDTNSTLQPLDALLKEQKPDVVYFNNGLHDLKFDKKSETHQVPIQQYQENLKAIVKRIRGTTSKVVFVNTTPILDARHAKRKAAFDRFNTDVVKFNKAAQQVMAELKVPVLDLYTVVQKNDPDKLMLADGTHFTPQAKELQAETVIADLRDRQFIPKTP